jgi:hypothetical protein
MRHLCALLTIVISTVASAQSMPRPEGQVQHHGAVGFISPAGWTVQNGGNGITTLTFPPNDNAPGGYEYVLRLVDRSWDGSPTWGFSPGGNYVTHMKKSNPH